MRKKKMVRTTMYLQKDVMAGLDELAKLKGTTRSQLIRDAMSMHLVQAYRAEMKLQKQHEDAFQGILGQIKKSDHEYHY